MPETLFVYVTCADLDEARRIGRALVEERLAACVNIRPHETIYRWQGSVEQGTEAGMLAKTTAASYPALEAGYARCTATRCPDSGVARGAGLAAVSGLDRRPGRLTGPGGTRGMRSHGAAIRDRTLPPCWHFLR